MSTKQCEKCGKQVNQRYASRFTPGKWICIECSSSENLNSESSITDPMAVMLGTRKKTSTKLTLLAFGAVILVVLIIAFQNKDRQQKSAWTAESQISDNYQPTVSKHFDESRLISSDGVSEDEQTIERYTSLLSQAPSQYKETQFEITTITLNSKRILAEEGTRLTCEQLLEAMNTILPNELRNQTQKYSEVLSSYIILRKSNQYTHEQAVKSLNEIMDALVRASSK